MRVVRETPQPQAIDEAAERFRDFVDAVEERLRRGLIAAYGMEVGREATASALAWAWEHMDRIDGLKNPAGYLYRVGQTAARREHRHSGRSLGLVDDLPTAVSDALPIEPALARALERLTAGQRSAVMLVDRWGYPLTETAEIMGVRVSTVRTHRRRALAKLRTDLGVAI
ncbi:MAG: RNA polymerase sigma factor (sigma-70 family) [Candidatus Aldehydirespiratoraceae bacterium]